VSLLFAAQQSLVVNLPRYKRHQYIVVQTVKELLKVHVHHPVTALRDVLTRGLHRLMGAASRSKPVAVL
jgi:hypothetical protein